MSTTAHSPFGVSSLPRVSALFATSPQRVHSDPRSVDLEPGCVQPNVEHPCSTTVRPQVFSTSRRFAPRSGLRACFIPQPRSGFMPVQGLLPLSSHPSSSEGTYPHAVITPPTRRPKPTATRDARDFEVFIRREMRCSGLVLPAPSLAPLFRFWLPRALVLHGGPGYPEPKRSCRWRGAVSEETMPRSTPTCCRRGFRLICHQTNRPARAFRASAFSTQRAESR